MVATPDAVQLESGVDIAPKPSHRPASYQAWSIMNMCLHPLYQAATVSSNIPVQLTNLFCEPTPFKAYAKAVTHRGSGSKQNFAASPGSLQHTVLIHSIILFHTHCTDRFLISSQIIFEICTYVLLLTNRSNCRYVNKKNRIIRNLLQAPCQSYSFIYLLVSLRFSLSCEFPNNKVHLFLPKHY